MDEDEPLIVREIVVEEKSTFSGLFDYRGQPLHRPAIMAGFDLTARNNISKTDLLRNGRKTQRTT